MKGIEGLPNPPINKGIIIKGIIKVPWDVIRQLYWWREQIKNPGKVNSNLIIIDNPDPKGPPVKPDKIYTPPVKIWFVVIKIRKIEGNAIINKERNRRSTISITKNNKVEIELINDKILL